MVETTIDPDVAETQLSLIPRDEMDALTEQAIEQRQYAQGIYSGIDVKRKRPDLYMLAVSWLAQGNFSEIEISRRTGLCRNCIAGIRKSQTSDIEQVKKEIGEQAFDSARMTMDAFRERMIRLLANPAALDKIGPDKLSLAYCQMVDKGLLASGEATTRIEIERVDPDAFNDRLRALPTDQRVRLASMGIGAESSCPKGTAIEAEFTESEVDQ